MAAASPAAVFRALHDRTGGRFFTVMALDRAAGLARRVYSSDPEAYPVSGTKPMPQSDWTDRVVHRGALFVANSVAEFAPHFPDHALIESLGCGAALNIPVGQGMVVGTVNILDVAGHFTPAEVNRCTAACADMQADLLAALARTPV